MRLAAILLLLAGALPAQVRNAAVAAAGGSATAPVAPGSLAFVTDYSTLYQEPTIAGAVVSIRPVGSSTPIPAQVENATSSGITFLVPADTPLGNAQLIYHQAGELTQWAAITIAASDFALYTTPAPGVNVSASGPATSNGLSTPVQPGQAIEIFGTGIGALPQSSPQVTLGGVMQTVLYAGIAPDEPGLIQINFQIASGTPDGCYVPMTVSWGSSTATSYLSKTSSGMPCQHPFQLSTSALQTLDAGGTVETGMISMTTALEAASAQQASRQESASATFNSLTAAEIASYFTEPPAQGCSVGSNAPAGLVVSIIGPPFSGSVTLQHASTTLTLTAASGFEYSLTLPPTADAPLNNLPAPEIAGGAWTWNSSGASGAPSGSFNFNLAAPVQLNSGAPIIIPTEQYQTITWNGAGFDSGAMLQMTLTGLGSGAVSCVAPAQAGALTIPANLLAQFTPGGSGVLTVSVTETGASIPHAFLQSSGTLMLVNWSSGDTRPVDFQ